MQSTAGRTGFGILIVLSVLFALVSMVRYLFLDPTLLNEVGFVMYDFHNSFWTTILYTHITTAAAALLIGPFNFMKSSHTKNIKRHRTLGKMYVGAIVVSSLCGIYLAVFAHGGMLAKTGFFFLSLAWLYTTYMAYKLARQKKIQGHKQWMVRSFAVTFAAVTFRFWLGGLAAFGNFDLAYGLSAWLCWTLNLIAVELWLRRYTGNTPNVQAKNAL